jgi:hypothetical protein
MTVFSPAQKLREKWISAFQVLSKLLQGIDEFSLSKTDEIWFIRVLQPHYAPDIATCAFFLFGCLKEELEGRNFSEESDVIGAGRQILSQKPVKALAAVMDDGICRLNRPIEPDVDYVH